MVIPKYPRLKEWAYAGMFFDFSAAAISHLAVGDGVIWLVGPITSIVFLALSWALRAPARRDFTPS